MEMSGDYRIEASREKVWEALNDPEVLKQAIPGCQELEKSADNQFTAKVRAKVGPVSANFAGTVDLTDINPPESYTISGEGKGGAAGFAKGSAEVRLSEDGSATLLHYEAKAQVGGKLAQIGSRLLGGTAQKLADEFFGNFSQIVVGGGAAIEAAPSPGKEEIAEAALRGAQAGGAAPQLPAGDEGKRGLSPFLWISGLIAVVILLLAIFGW